MNLTSRKNLAVKILSIFTAFLFCGATAGSADVSQAAFDQLLKTNKELLETVTKLSKKVDNLEGRVDQAERTQQPASVAAPTGGEPGDGVLRTQGGDIQLSGFVDTSFNWNLRTPPTPAGGTNATGNSTLRAFDRESNTFDVNNIQLNIKRPAPENGGVGFTTEFVYGTDAQVIESAGFLGGTDEFSIQEAFVELKAPIGSGLTVWIGKFATLHGAEVIESYMNWNASRGLLFNNAIPFTHTGIRAFYNWLDGKVTTGLGLVNGWDNVIDNNNFKDIEAMVKWTPSENFSIAQNFMVGSQIVEDQGDMRYLFDTVATWVPLPNDLPKLTLMANFDYGTEERLGKISPALEGGPADWQGYALYAKYDLYDWLTLAARWEQFWDDQGARTGTAALNQLWEMTYTADFKVYKNLLTRLEYRHDNADSKTAFDGGTAQNQDTVGASFIYLFG